MATAASGERQTHIYIALIRPYTNNTLRKYCRQDLFDDFAQFSKPGDDNPPQNGHNGYDEDHIEEVYDEEEDEIVYEPQNGYHDDGEYQEDDDLELEEEVQVEVKPSKKEKPKKEK